VYRVELVGPRLSSVKVGHCLAELGEAQLELSPIETRSFYTQVELSLTRFKSKWVLVGQERSSQLKLGPCWFETSDIVNLCLVKTSTN